MPSLYQIKKFGSLLIEANVKIIDLKNSINSLYLYENHNLASDPFTPPEVLKQLANHDDPQIKEKIANNPNTPIDSLINLAAQGHNIENNPVFPLIHLEDPMLLNKIPLHIGKGLIQHAEINPNLFNLFSEVAQPIHYKGIAEKTKNPNILHKIATDPATMNNALSIRALYSITNNKFTRPETLTLLKKKLPAFVANHPNTPKEILHDFIDNPQAYPVHKPIEIMAELSANTGLQPDTMHKFIDKNIDSELDQKIANHPNADESVLEKLKNHYSSAVRIDARKNLAALQNKGKK